jgi:parallel beta-helix repeat protein
VSQTLYVAPNGSDANPGTLDRPFASIQSALRTLPEGSGGTIMVRGGTYQLEDTIAIYGARGGTADSRLTIRNYANEKVNLNATALADSSSSAILLGWTQYVDIQGLEIYGADTGIVMLGNSREISLRDNTVRDIQRAGIAAYSAQQGDIKNIFVDGNTVYRTNLFNRDRPAIQPGGWGSGIVFSRTQGGAITNNTVFENYGEGIAVTLSDSAVTRGNTIYDNFSVQLYVDHTSASIFESNFIYNTGNLEFYRRYEVEDGLEERAAAGIQLANEFYDDANPLRDNLIRNNIVIGGYTPLNYGNYQFGGGLQNVDVVNNTFYANSTSAKVIEIQPDRHSNSDFINNIFYAERNTQNAVIPSSTAGLNFSHNLWYGSDPGQAASASDVYSDPLLNNAGGFQPIDYQSQAGSAAIDRGTATDLVGADFFGTARPFSATILGRAIGRRGNHSSNDYRAIAHTNRIATNRIATSRITTSRIAQRSLYLQR